mgnify:CR=1 FL=1
MLVFLAGLAIFTIGVTIAAQFGLVGLISIINPIAAYFG